LPPNWCINTYWNTYCLWLGYISFSLVNLQLKLYKSNYFSTGDVYIGCTCKGINKKAGALSPNPLQISSAWIARHYIGMHGSVQCYYPHITNRLHTPWEARQWQCTWATVSTILMLSYSLFTSFIYTFSSLVLYTTDKGAA